MAVPEGPSLEQACRAFERNDWLAGIQALKAVSSMGPPQRSMARKALWRRLKDTSVHQVPRGVLAAHLELREWVWRQVKSLPALWSHHHQMGLPAMVGAALVVLDGKPGTVVRLHVGWTAPSPIRVGMAFEQAVYAGYRAARSWLHEGRSEPAPVDKLPFWVEPLSDDAEPVDGASVGLAAAAAWVSFLSGEPLPVPCAWTGVLDSVDPRMVGEVKDDTLSGKVDGLKHLFPGLLLVHPTANGANASLNGLNRLSVAHLNDAARFLPESKDRPWLGLAEQESVETEHLKPHHWLILHLLAAAEGPLSIQQLEAASGRSKKFGDGELLVGPIRTLRDEGWIREPSPGRWELSRAVNQGSAASIVAEAHELLAGAPGDDPSWNPSAWLVRMMRAQRVCASDERADTVRAVLTERSAAQPGLALSAVRDVCVAGLADQLTGCLPASSHAAAMAELVVLLHRAPAPVRSTVDALLVDSPLDQVLGLQAVFEASLHLVQAATAKVELAPGTSEDARNESRAEFRSRPNIGVLVNWLHVLRQVAPDSERWAPVETLRSALQAADDRRAADESEPTFVDVLRTTKNGFNAFHAPCGVAAFADRAHNSTDFGALMDGVIALVRVLVAARKDGFRFDTAVQAGGTGVRGSEESALPGISALPDQDHTLRWFFDRGSIDGAPRKWAFDRPERLPALPKPSPGGKLRIAAQPRPLAVAMQGVLAHRKSDALTRVAAIDRFVGLLLRLAVLPAFITAHQAYYKSRTPLQRLQGGGNHRLMFRTLTGSLALPESVGPVCTRLGRRLKDGPGRAALVFLIDGIERLQHAPGPVESWGRHADDLFQGAVALMQHLDGSEGSFAIDGVERRDVGKQPLPAGAWTWTCPDLGTSDLSAVMRPHEAGFEFLLQERNRKKNKPGRALWCPLSVTGELVI